MPIIVHRTPHDASHVARTRCSTAYVFTVLVRLINIVAPFLLAYAMNNLWLREVTEDVQPEVHFTHELMVMVEGSQGTMLWSTESVFNKAYRASGQLRSSQVSSVETDADRDGVPEGLDVTVQVPLKAGETVNHARCLLFFNYKIKEHVTLEMDSLAYIDVSSPSNGRGAWVDAELRLRQRDVLPYKSRLSYPSPLPKGTGGEGVGTADLLHKELLGKYTERNFTTVLDHMYHVWTPGMPGSATDAVRFELKAHIRYPREQIRYRPGFWETLKFAWVQYVSVLLVVRYFTQMVTNFVFENNVLETTVIRPQPRENRHTF